MKFDDLYYDKEIAIIRYSTIYENSNKLMVYGLSHFISLSVNLWKFNTTSSNFTASESALIKLNLVGKSCLSTSNYDLPMLFIIQKDIKIH